MRWVLLVSSLVVALLAVVAQAQFGFRGGAFNGFFRSVNSGFRSMFHPVMNMFSPPSRPFTPNKVNGDFDETGGTKEPVSTGIDKLYPDDCGRDKDKGTGLLCFPDGELCKNRVSRQGNARFGNHLYWFSWESDDSQLRNAKWDWFNARNYCRKRCMDLVAIETQQEYDFLKSHIGGAKYFWTSGRLCDFDGCDAPRFFPKNINGWFWSSNQAKMSPTNGNGFHDWSPTGGARKRQPDNREGGESCMAVLNNFYGDGIKWHDVGCNHEKPIVCEDVEGHLNFARQTFPNIRIP